MDAERMREYLLGLPFVVETEQWGGLVYWVGDKASGGKMMAMLNPEAADGKFVSFSAGPEKFAELLERDGLVPAPYLARGFWVAADRWDVLRNAEWEELMQAAHGITLRKLTKKSRALLDGAKVEMKKAFVARRKARAEKTV